MARPLLTLSPVFRWCATAVVLVVLFLWLDASDLLTELQRVPSWVVWPALGLSLVQVGVSAWRWRYTAARLRLPLPYAVAVREYYLATFLNQVLPGGVMGDVNRAWRHSLGTQSRLASVHAVLIERLSGQLVLVLLAALLIGVAVGLDDVNQPATATMRADTDYSRLLVGLAIGGLVLVALVMGFRKRLLVYSRQLAGDLRAGLFRWPVWPVQLASSLLVVGSYLGVFMVLAAGAGYLGDEGSVLTLLALCSALLISMVVPLTVAGWGVREGAAAVLWPLAGLPPEQGVALSIGYGLIVLLSSLPGSVFVVSSVASAR